MTLKGYLEQRHIDLDSGRSCLALEREYWQATWPRSYEFGQDHTLSYSLLINFHYKDY